MYSILFLMAILLVPCVASYDLVAKNDNANVISLLKKGLKMIVRASTDYYYWKTPTWVKNCLVEFSCLLEKNPNYRKCAMYVVKCAAGELTNMASCAYNMVGDLSNNILFEGLNVMNYDFGHLIYDIFACAGYDFDEIKNMVKSYAEL